MKTHAKKETVDIFIGPIACSCAGGPSPARQEMIARAFALEGSLKEMGSRFEVHTWQLGDDRDYEEGLAALRMYLQDAGEEELANRLAFAVNDATPSVALNGKLIWVRDCPTADEITSNA